MTGIERRTEEVEVFAVGGRRFLDRQDAERYLAELQRISSKRYRFFVVDHNFDVTEGRGWMSCSAVAAPSEGALIVWLLSMYGGPRIDWMGGRTDAWRISRRISDPLETTEEVAEAFGALGFREVVVLDAEGAEAERLETGARR